MENKNKTGHLCALLTIMIWGTTFISTKILLVDFRPIENFSRSIFYGHLSHLFLKEEGRLRAKFFVGFAVAMVGIFLISFNGAKLELGRFVNPMYLFNIIFLGLGASALCFVSWNFAVNLRKHVNS